MATATDTSSALAPPALRVFVVEDSPTVRDLLTEQLHDIEGVRVVGSAQSEQDAVSALRQTPCDVIILDIKLRQGSGIGVLRTLGPAVGSSVACIIFSNYTENEYRRLATQLGAAHFFDKSSDFAALVEVITALARKHWQR